MSIDRFSFPTPIHFGAGARRLVAGAPAGAQASPRPLLVTDRGVRRAAAACPHFSATCRGSASGVFSEIWGNPVQAAGDRRRRRVPRAPGRRGHRPGRRRRARRGQGDRADGAPSRATSSSTRGTTRRCARSTEPIPVVRRAADDRRHRLARSGARASSRTTSTHVKKIIFSPQLLATCGVRRSRADARPAAPAITAATGMDALTHNVESYLSPAYHPLCDGIALEGVRICGAARCRSRVRDGADLAGAQRHADELDDGRDRVPEGPRRRAFLRPRAVDGRRPAPRPRQRHHDRPRDALQPAPPRRRRWPSSRASPGVPGAAAAAQRRRGGGVRRLARPHSRPIARHPGTARRAAGRPRRSRATTSRRWSTSPSTTSATRPIRASARRADFERIFAAALIRRGSLAPPTAYNDALPRPTLRPMLKIGISACFFHADPERPIFKGMTLQYIEQNVAHWLMQRDVLALHGALAGGPARGGPAAAATVDAYADGARRARADGRRRRLPGDLRRDGAASPSGTAIACATTTRSRCCAPSSSRRKPVLGVCRGAQVINVA